MAERGFKVGLRVRDVDAAADFYAGLGFEKVGSVPDPGGRPVMAVLERDGVHLIVDALEGMPLPETRRERQIKQGPRGLGVAIGIGVDDLDAALGHCVTEGCDITSEPEDAPWGDRVFECTDPFGYQLEISQPTQRNEEADGLAAVRATWFDDR